MWFLILDQQLDGLVDKRPHLGTSGPPPPPDSRHGRAKARSAADPDISSGLER